MSLDEELKTLTTVSGDFEGTAIVSALEAEGIQAKTVGGYTAGFRAEAPGSVSVIVHENDLARAQAILEELRRHGAEVDWSKVDVEHPDDDEPTA